MKTVLRSHRAESPRLSSPRRLHFPVCPVAPVAKSSEHDQQTGPPLRNGCNWRNTPSGPPCVGPRLQPVRAGHHRDQRHTPIPAHPRLRRRAHGRFLLPVVWHAGPGPLCFLERTYSPSGLNLNVGRSCIGASDYSRSVYSFDDTPDDMNLGHFSLKHDEAYILPTLREIRGINPSLFLWPARGVRQAG